MTTAVAPTRFLFETQFQTDMKQKLLLPTPLQALFKCALAVVMFVIIVLIAKSCTHTTKAQVIYDNKLKSENVKMRAQIEAYNSLLHRIWVDKPNYFEEVLEESDEWVNLQNVLENDFQDAFKFTSQEDSLSYHLNWHNGDNTVRVIKHVISPHEKDMLLP